MKLFGFEFKRVVKDERLTQPDPEVGQLLLGLKSSLPNPARGARVLQQFVLPLIDTGDKWQVLALNVYKDSLLTMTRGRYNVCGLTEIIEALGIALTPSTVVSYEKLRKLHCVDFSLVPESIYRQIPHLANHVISGGEITHASLRPDEVIDV
jgi:hypothetical protein